MSSLLDGVALRRATPDDLPIITALRTQVGWHTFEWALRDAMSAPHARCYLAVDGTGDVLAVGSGICYGALGVVGNMVVDAPHRRRGLGSAILEAVLAFLEGERGCTQVELNATADGRQLYARHGFVLAGSNAGARIERSVDLAVAPEDAVTDAPPSGLAEVAAYDEARFGGDRTPVLATTLADPDRPALLVRRHGSLAGYAVLRDAGGRLGPWLADDPAAASALLSAAFRLAPQLGWLSTNLPLDNEPGAAWLRDLGVQLDPWDGRMRRGSGVTRRFETIYGNVIGALG
ncbi:MAG: GNAT family N-acetyltransferase [Candidatus Limnocylindria bacterium]